MNRPAPATGDRRLRVLVIATYFPKPRRTVMGVWALAQAKALLRSGLDVAVVSPTSWVPGVLRHVPARQGKLGKASAWAACPSSHRWGELVAKYPRWLLYDLGSRRGPGFRHPALPLAIGWISGRRGLERALREHRPDVVLGHHTARGGFLAERLQRRFDLPFVTVDHDYEEVRACESHPGRRRIYGQVTGRAFASIAVSRTMEADLRRIFPAAKPRTIHNGTERPPDELSRRPRPAELRGRLLVFSAGFFFERKAMPLLVEAFAGVAPRHPDALLRIAGDGAERPAVERAIESAGLRGRVQLLGAVDHRTVLQEMAWSDIFALVGWQEPFATVFLEAMAAGKPQVWASDGGIADVLRDGVHGCAVAPRDLASAESALDRLLSDGRARAEMGMRAQELFESQLTWDAHAAKLADLLHEAAGRTHAAGRNDRRGA